MKKIINKILLCDIIFILLMLSISFFLKLYNYQFLTWIKYFTMLIVFIGLISGTIQLTIKKKSLCIILGILEIVIVGFVDLFLVFYYSSNIEEVVIVDNKKMIKETHSVLLSNYINYYDYENIFIRNNKVRIYEAHDDYIGEYLYTIYYDEDGNIINREGNEE